MSILALSWARNKKIGNPAGKAVLICLANFANEKGECWPSQATIAKETELCVRTVRDWLKKLQEYGLISRSRRCRLNGTRTSDILQLNIGSTFSKLVHSKEEVAVSYKEARVAGRTEKEAIHSYPSGISHIDNRHLLPNNEQVREYKKKYSDFLKSKTTKLKQGEQMEQLPINKRLIAVAFVSLCEEDNIKYWQDWLQNHQMPPLEVYGISVLRGSRVGYQLPMRWPPAQNNEAYANCLTYFYLKFPSPLLEKQTL